MAKITSSFKSQSFLYDFTVDGGAISTIGMGIFIPSGALIQTFGVKNFTPITSGGAGVIDVGVVGFPIAVINNAGLPNGDFRDYNVPERFLQNIICNQNNVQIPAALEVIVTISAFALTAGAFICTINYIEY